MSKTGFYFFSVRHLPDVKLQLVVRKVDLNLPKVEPILLDKMVKIVNTWKRLLENYHEELL